MSNPVNLTFKTQLALTPPSQIDLSDITQVSYFKFKIVTHAKTQLEHRSAFVNEAH